MQDINTFFIKRVSVHNIQRSSEKTGAWSRRQEAASVGARSRSQRAIHTGLDCLFDDITVHKNTSDTDVKNYQNYELRDFLENQVGSLPLFELGLTGSIRALRRFSTAEAIVS
mmetsp:Transcript_26280/g.53860  ORF Transcript_26280/g.53860 Transcript_26280/m.53860 type:complete len:113 (+) Transcript_26280:389-727(+)